MKAAIPALLLALVLPGLALADTTSVRDLRRGMPAMIDGAVERITDDDEFLLADETGSILVYIGPNPMPVRAGDRVRVAGTVDDDGPLELYATEVTLPDGRVVPLPNRDD
jgi:uncharacterized protein YdeI (BOF family)